MRFSQLHGYPVHVQTLPPSLAPALDGGQAPAPKPLETSHGAFPAGRASALIKFLSRHHALFGLPTDESGAKSELKISLNTTDAELNEDDQAPDPTGVASTRVDQYIGGLPVLGRYALGQFDPKGNLYSVITRLLPVERTTLQLTPAYPLEALAGHADPAIEALSLLGSPELRWLSGVRLAGPGVTSSARLVLLPVSEAAGSRLTLAYELHVRAELNEAVLYLDAQTGAKLRAFDNTPTEWHDEPGALISATAPDETGTPQTILACRRDGQLYMGFGSNHLSGSTRPFSAGKWLSVIDSGDARSDNRTPYRQTLSTPGATAFDPARGFSASKTQLTSAILNARLVLDWWAARGWRSWDGRGAHLGFIVNARPNEDGTPSLNAWGGGGYILTGGAAGNAAGATFASDLEVVGHEFMHNVVSATSGLVYDYESGAINEALADLFGVALTVNPTTDRFADATLGTVRTIRNLQNPPAVGQPNRYSNFVETADDARGVHTNSGILNQAHWLMVQGGSFNGVQVSALKATKVLELIRNTNRHGRLSNTTSLEEFAAAVIGRCRLAAVFTMILTGDGDPLNNDCAMVERAYRAVELVDHAERVDLIVESAESIGDYLRLRVRNGSAEPLNLYDYRWDLMNGTTIIQSKTIPATGGGGDGYAGAWVQFEHPEGNRQEGTTSWVLPGGTALVSARHHQSVLGDAVLTTPQALSVRLTRSSGGTEANTLNNQLPVSFSSEISGLDGMPQPADGGLSATLAVSHLNLAASRMAPITSVLLTRSTASGPFSVIPGTEQTLAGVTPAEGASSSASIVGRVFFPRATLSFSANNPWTIPETVVLPDVTFVDRSPFHQFREVWFDTTGGRPELAGHRQIYLLSDALNVVEEHDEGNNLLCLNCGAVPTVVRFPRDATTLESLFPARYQPAVARLRSLREGELREIVESVGHAGLSFRR